jgi:hypothetical protein
MFNRSRVSVVRRSRPARCTRRTSRSERVSLTVWSVALELEFRILWSRMGDAMRKQLLCGLCLLLSIGCARTEQEAKADARNVPDGSASPCSLMSDGTCQSSDPGVLCCPQRGRPYDFTRACWKAAAETVYCNGQPSPSVGGTACGSAAVVACAATPDGTKAWYEVPGLWEGPGANGYVDCASVHISVLDDAGDVVTCR